MSAAPHQVIVGTGDRIEENDLVEFRLIYEGELRPSGNRSRGEEMHAIRRSLHTQLRRLWTVNANLRQLADNVGNRLASGSLPPGATEQQRFDSGILAIGKQWSRAGYELVPLVTEEHVLRCSLDILLLRPEDKKYICNQGDIDGQIKTLFDALRLPSNSQEAGGIGPQEGETPLFCLLEDDRLISEVHITTDQLLMLPNHRDVRPNDAHAVIHVKLNHKNARTFNNYFG
jgi:hypothetical protein